MVGTDDYMLEYDILMNEERENTVGGGIGGGGGADGAGGVEQIWAGNQQQQQPQPQPEDDDLLFIDFPALMADHFPCMSSSSSSTSSTPAAPPTRNTLSTSSPYSTASWAINMSEPEGDRPDPNQHLHAPQDQEQHFVAAAAAPAPGTLPSPAAMEVFPTDHNGRIYNMNCMDDNGMENFSFMDLMDEDWDPCSLLQFEKSVGEEEEKIDLPPPDQNQNQSNRVPEGGKEEEGSPHDLGVVFLEWLKSNKEHISGAEMRSIKLRKATVECASKNLGTTREGKKQLLKLILEWVEQAHLRKRRMPQESDPPPASAAPQMPCQLDHFPNPPSYPNHVSGLVAPCFPPPAPWLPTPQPFGGGGAYMADPYSNILNRSTTTRLSDQYRQMWQPSQFIPNSNGYFTAGAGTVGHGGKNKEQYYSYPQNYRGERLTRPCSSATKEARQKRMARQRRLFRHNHHHQQQNLADNVSQVLAEQNTQQQKKPMAVAEQKQVYVFA